MILMDAASKTLSVVGAPKLAQRPAPRLAAASSPGSGAAVGTRRRPTRARPRPSPTRCCPRSASPTREYSCLNNIWTRESGWRWNAENASGAYGIPQALPGSRWPARARLADQPDDPDQVGPGLHQGQLRDALQRVVVLAGARLVLTDVRHQRRGRLPAAGTAQVRQAPPGGASGRLPAVSASAR